MKKVRILSLDGGGIRGVIPATVLTYVENKLIDITGNPNARLADYFDIIAGTSTGGILSCFYLTPNDSDKVNKPNAKYKAEQALGFYVNRGVEIFNESKYFDWFGARQLINAAQYSPKKLEKIVFEEFGLLKMKALLKPCIVTTYNLVKKTTFFFSSREPIEKQREFYIKDVVRSTSAAPTYFPPADIKNLVTNEKMVNIDGGVFANNPTMCVYAESRNSKFDQVNDPAAKDMLILSIGTGGGQFELPNANKSGRWGVINWAKSIPEIMMDGSIDTVDYQMKNLFGTLEKEHQLNYKRIDVPLDKRKYSKDMANASKENIKKLEAAGKAALDQALIASDKEYRLDRFIELLVENAPEN
jgi:patatin-like phospholipase/acyl hydrolase